jgi:lysophospholipase L1-like esterase
MPLPPRRSLRLLFAVFAALALSAATGTSTVLANHTQKVGPPNVMTALGDSITRGFHTGTILQDVPANSWATGTNTTVNSLCLRIKAINPVMNCGANNPPNGGNDAVTGARASGTNAQAVNAVARNPKPELVAILIGANDVCTSSQTNMTSVASFRASIETTLNTLSTGLPNARIQVMSIPNIFNLWNVGRTSASARFAWSLLSICQSMLANPTSTTAADVARRAAVQQRNVDFNTQLQQACAGYIHCRFDNNAAYNLPFVLSDLSTIDFFHPNIQGQAKAANVAWTAGYNYADLTTPTTTIERDRAADGSDDWYKANVSVTLDAVDGNDAVAGSEYFYQLQGAQDQPWTKYTGPFTVSDPGITEVVARSVDSNGNVETGKHDLIKIDKTAPTFVLSCPAGPYELGSTQSSTVSAASDDRSGFAEDPNGDLPIDTSAPGDGQSNVVEIQDRASNTASHSCSYDVHYPTPGAPELIAGVTPNATGTFTLGWSGTDPSLFGIRYTLEHRDADDAGYSEVASGLDARTHAFASEGEGTWTYRVKGSDSDLGLETDYSGESEPVKVDKSAPSAPTLSADRAPEYGGDGGWFKDSVTVSFSDNGDPDLADGSAGTGVDAASVDADAVRSTSGSHTVSGTVTDNVANESQAGSLDVQVDASAPSVSVTCPAAVLLHSVASATISAGDDESGLASDPSGTVLIDTSTVGSKTTSATATDNVGHTTSQSCVTAVRYAFSGVLQPIDLDGSSIFKLGSTVPVKFKLTDVLGTSAGSAVAKLTVAKVSNAIEGDHVEAVSTSAATTGNLFRYDPVAEQYIFNLATKPLSSGTWNLKITLDDGTSYIQEISLK